MKQLDMRAKMGLNVMAVKRTNEVKVSPHADYMIQKGDVLVVVGQNRDIEKLEKHE
ncbi:MAG: TrkA C-terminal domain-containing protein [Tepidanaerobacteraceae bacterium]|nr:TrkA C-terminal domain-containing protein [Tepidanaerobacteraceae bacterium]